MIRLQPNDVSADLSRTMGSSGEQIATAMDGCNPEKRAGTTAHEASLEQPTGL